MVEFPEIPRPIPNHKIFSKKESTKKVSGAKPQRVTSPEDFSRIIERYNADYLDTALNEEWYYGGRHLAQYMLIHRDGSNGDNPTNLDAVTRPMLFCYRHYVELALKKLVTILRSGSAAQKPMNKDPLWNHDIAKLWKEARRHFPSVFETDGNEYTATESLLRELNLVDPDSQTFRYRRSKRGKDNQASMPGMEIDNVINVMESLKNEFDGLIEYAQVCVDILNDPET